MLLVRHHVGFRKSKPRLHVFARLSSPPVFRLAGDVVRLGSFLDDSNSSRLAPRAANRDLRQFRSICHAPIL